MRPKAHSGCSDLTSMKIYHCKDRDETLLKDYIWSTTFGLPLPFQSAVGSQMSCPSKGYFKHSEKGLRFLQRRTEE